MGGACGRVVEEGWMSPLAVVGLLVKDEIAQPVHELSAEGVAIRGVADGLCTRDEEEGGGKTESGMEAPCLRTRVR